MHFSKNVNQIFQSFQNSHNLYFKMWESASIFIVVISVISLTSHAQRMDPSKIDSYAFRLKPNEDLKEGIISFAKKQNLKAGAIVTCVGSLTQFHMRFANQEKGTKQIGHFEIVSMIGTFSDSTSHLHISVSDSTGQTTGGHLLEGNLIYTTAEIVVIDLKDIEFKREPDSTFGYKELFIKPRKKNKK
jgi:predicted DNA-binding protein with PD1-like motif